MPLELFQLHLDVVVSPSMQFAHARVCVNNIILVMLVGTTKNKQLTLVNYTLVNYCTYYVESEN